MNKKILLSLLVLSGTAGANAPFQNGMFGNNIWSDFNKQFQHFDSQMREMQSTTSFGTQSRRYIDEQTNSYIIQIQVNNLDKENLDISTKDDTIYIKGSIQISKKTDNSSRTASSRFSQSYSLPTDADEDNIDANFKDGVLTVSIPKLDKPKPKVKKIQIK